MGLGVIFLALSASMNKFLLDLLSHPPIMLCLAMFTMHAHVQVVAQAPRSSKVSATPRVIMVHDGWSRNCLVDQGRRSLM
jgi:hypothetical protein